MTEQPAELVPVDPPERPKTIHGTALAVREADERPIVPAWARNRDEARQLAAWLAKYGAHVTLYHLTRVPQRHLTGLLVNPIQTRAGPAT
jgi:DNA segregation ATPase FtsK/SpoIIIE, S-DNA-T family